MRPGNGSCSLMSVAPSCASVSASAGLRGFGLPSGDRGHQLADDGAGHDEHDQRDDVVLLRDRKCIERLGEVIVGKEEGCDRARSAGTNPPIAATATTTIR